MFEFKVETIIAEIGSAGDNAKRLTLTSWGNRPAKLDLRVWRTGENPPKPGRGVTLSLEEAEALQAALNDYMGK